MKRKLAIIFLIIFLIILGFLSVVFFMNLGSKNKEYYISEFTKIGEEAYSEYYYEIYKKNYPNENELTAYLKKYDSIGLKFDLETLKGYAINMEKADHYNLINEFLKNNKKCTEKDITVIIYPNNPYKSADFKSEIKMNCQMN